MSALISAIGSKQILLRRSVRAVLLSVAIQYLLLTVFLLFVNFQIFHPLNWVTSTIKLLFSFYTWLGSIPSLVAILIYGVSLYQQHVKERLYCPSRYKWLLHNGPCKLGFLAAHLIVGYLTAWLYTGYLNANYRNLIYKCYGQDCLSSNHLYLLGIGTAAGLYYFVRVYGRNESTAINLDIVDRPFSRKLRELLYSTMLKAPIDAIIPLLEYTVCFWIMSSYIKLHMSRVLSVDADERLDNLFDIAMSARLLLYAWLLTAQVLANMHLMRCFYHICLGKDLPLVISRNHLVFANEEEVTLTSALGTSNLYIVQYLAARFLYRISQSANPHWRSELFQLSEPGNRPVNWREFCDQCLNNLNNFTDELSESIRKLSGSASTQSLSPTTLTDGTAKLVAEKALLRQYNQMHGIRPIVSPLKENALQLDARGQVRRVPNLCERISDRLTVVLQKLYHRIPGLVYMFKETEDAKTSFLLSNSMPLVLMTQGLAHILVAATGEDSFGIVQADVAVIIKALHRLKCELDKLSHVMAIGRGANSSFHMLRGAVRRSLYNICTTYNDFLSGMIMEKEQLRQLQTFLHQD